MPEAQPVAQSTSLQSFRTVLEGLILVGVIWLASSTTDQGKANAVLQAQMVTMSGDLRDIRSQLADVPTMARTMAKVEVRLEEHERRILDLEQQSRRR